MKNTFLIIQNVLKKFSDELNSTDWSAFPVSEGSSIWNPILLIQTQSSKAKNPHQGTSTQESKPLHPYLGI